MTTMTTDQRQVQNAANFRHALGILHRASVAVILVRSREPYRAIDAMQTFAHAEQDFDFKYWTCTGGWHTPNKARPEEAPLADNTTEVMSATRAIGGEASQGAGFGNGMFVMMYPHPWLGKAPPMIQMVKDYARALPETKKRLILLCPPGFALPEELQDDVVILDFDLPSYHEQRDVYERTMAALPAAKRPKYTGDDVDRILSAGAGMTSHEFETALSRATIANRTLLPKLPIDTIVNAVMDVKVEAVKRTEVLEVLPVENMDNVGGLENLKDWVSKRRACFTQEARDFGVDPLKGILLAGPPGTGKSLISKAIAYALGLPLIKFDVSRVFASLVGQSEARVEQALKMAEAMAPCVLFLDEIDKALGGSHDGGGDSGVSKRVLGKILTWLQENDKPVFVVFSANRVEQLPTELIRRGRLDEIFSVSVPNASERRQVLEIHLRKRKQDASKIDLQAAVDASENYVPAELEAAVKDAVIEAFGSGQPVTGELIAAQLAQMTPLSVAFADQFAAMRTWSEQNARPANGTSSDPQVPKARVRQRGSASPTPSGVGRNIDLN